MKKQTNIYRWINKKKVYLNGVGHSKECCNMYTGLLILGRLIPCWKTVNLGYTLGIGVAR